MERATIHLLARIAFWCAAMFAYVCAILPGNPGIVSYDKGNHLIAFGTLAILGRVGWERSGAQRIAVVLIAFGGLIELSQALPEVHRDASWADLAADTVAVVLGLAVGALLLRVIRQYHSPDPTHEAWSSRASGPAASASQAAPRPTDSPGLPGHEPAPDADPRARPPHH